MSSSGEFPPLSQVLHPIPNGESVIPSKPAVPAPSLEVRTITPTSITVTNSTVTNAVTPGTSANTNTTNTSENKTNYQNKRKRVQYASAKHEAESVFAIHRKKLGMRIFKEDFQRATKEDLTNVDKSELFKGPRYGDLRLLTSIKKLSDNTGMHPSRIGVETVTISSKKVDIAWLTFEDEDTVKALFKNAAIKQTSQLNIFPVIPDCALDRKKHFEDILKNLHNIDESLRYQIRLGNGNFRIFVKYFEEGKYEPYKEIPKEFIDPEENAAPVKTDNTDILPEDNEDEDIAEIQNWRVREAIKTRNEYKRKLKARKSPVSLLQISEFLNAYILGTKTDHTRAFLELCPQETLGGADPEMDM